MSPIYNSWLVGLFTGMIGALLAVATLEANEKSSVIPAVLGAVCLTAFVGMLAWHHRRMLRRWLLALVPRGIRERMAARKEAKLEEELGKRVAFGISEGPKLKIWSCPWCHRMVKTAEHICDNCGAELDEKLGRAKRSPLLQPIKAEPQVDPVELYIRDGY